MEGRHARLDLLRETRELQVRLMGLQVLLGLHQRQIAALERRVHSRGSAGHAARRLLAMKSARAG
jgi:hypothetical protein